ncbi:CAP-Gly domain protein [Mesorhizobium sp. BR1-1-12]|uniref:CAP-Gly domain protein n=1 Tax=Mesorhizobium sp. BR1-1-12 TaxID=2876657 RepID=UPI001CD15BAB|nr:CAP-Gly domain protein [Mesorhizobium sp. BR1-1-12]MBZ9973543.1 CAP-Gly domain protein [Mesorhizobium sp. BR1-1-12]
MTESRSDLYPGQEVICIDDQVPLADGSSVKDANITEGQTYRLRWVGQATHYVFGDYLGVKLEGINSGFGEAWGQPDAAYAAKRFRPLVKDPLAFARRIAANPHDAINAPEGPVRGKPVREGAPKRKVKEEV